MSSWTWFIVGALLLASELVMPTGFYLFLFGVAAFVVGGISMLGVLPGWEVQVGLYAVVAVSLAYTFATRLRTKLLGKSKSGSNDAIGKSIVIADLIRPGETGSGELWGSPWRVKNVDSRDLPAKCEGIIVHAEGVTLHVRNKD